jgi:hypothetical protein
MQGALFGQNRRSLLREVRRREQPDRDTRRWPVDHRYRNAPVKPAEFVIIHISQYAPEA